MANSGTTVIYNGIELHNVVTRDFQQTLKYDDSGTDLLYHEFKIRVEGIMHVQDVPQCPTWIAGAGGSGPQSHVAHLWNQVNRMLAQPRGNFEMRIGSQQLLKAVPGAANKKDPDRDVDNGPKPSDVSVTHIAGDKVFRIAFTIVIAKVHCLTPFYSIGVLNNRWSVSETMDDHFRITRTIRGRLRLADSSVPAHFYKALVVPGLEPGFRRAAIEYQVDKDGLTCDYQVTDQQVHTAAPWPATHISGTHTESTNDGVNYLAECNIRLEGPVNADKRDMMTQAYRIVDAKLLISSHKMNQDYLVQQVAFVDHIGEIPAIEVRYRIQHVFGKAEREQLGNLYYERLGTPIELEALNGHEYKNTVSQTPALYGYDSHAGPDATRDPAAALFVMHCYLQSPCSNQHSIATVPPDEGEEKEDAGYTPTTHVSGEYVPELPKNEDGDYYHESGYEAMYLSARLTNRYYWQYCRAQLPIAASASEENEDTTVVANLARPQARREVRIIAERVGQYPSLPRATEQYTDGEIKGTLLRYWDKGEAPRLAPDGRKLIFTVEAYYLYALNRPPRDDESTRVGVLPFSSVEQTAAAFTRNSLHDSRLALGEEVS